MDTPILDIELTEKQFTNASTLSVDPVKGLSYWLADKKVVVVSERELTAQELSDLRTALLALPDEYSQTNRRANFDLVAFQTSLASILPSLSSPNLRWEFAALNTYATNKDFEGMAGYMDMLVAIGAAQQSDDDAVVALLTAQGIVIA